MNTSKIDAALCAKMFLAGARNLEAKKEIINELNVFPVPDGDTGTNMTLTIMAAAKEVAALEEPDMTRLAKAISSGSLRGARGNSGVILSQLFRGFSKVVKDKTELDTEILVLAFHKAVETAYKAVMKPKEGTILTVAKGASDKAASLYEENPDIDMESFIAGVIEEAEVVLNKTPDMLPVLKEAGVVDSGGQGLLEVLKGAQAAFLGIEIVTEEEEEEEVVIPNPYCTEFVIIPSGEFGAVKKVELENALNGMGECLSISITEEGVQVHLHTEDPGAILTKALPYGMLNRIEIYHAKEEHEEKEINKGEAEVPVEEEKPRKPVGFISVAAGDGLSDIFRELGVDYIIEGGQTMNPSTEDMLNAISHVNADTIYILPNNKNIIMAANQARDLTSDKEIVVVPTKTVPQGVTAVVSFDESLSSEENLEAMSEEIVNVKTGQITYAVRDTHIDDKEIHQGDIMCVGDHSIVAVGTDIDAVVMEAMKEMADEDSELISLYYGSEMTEEAAEALAEQIRQEYGSCDVEVNYGGQPIYYYILSVE